MAGRKWTPEEAARLKSLILNDKLTYFEAGMLLDRSHASIRSKCLNMGIQSQVVGRREPPPEVQSYDKPLRISGDFMACGDVHSPCVNWELAVRMAQIARRYLEKPRVLVCGGDLFNMDTFSVYTQLIPAPTMQEEIDTAKYAIEMWLRVFDTVYFIPGNHDYRWLLKFDGAFPAYTLIELFRALVGNYDGFKMSEYSYLEAEASTGLWHISHLAEYAQTPLFKGKKLLSTYKDRHIVLFHQHHMATALDESGRYLLVDCPMLANQDHIAYARLRDSTKPKMKEGFGMLRNGAWYTFSNHPALTDWEKFWLKD